MELSKLPGRCVLSVRVEFTMLLCTWNSERGARRNSNRDLELYVLDRVWADCILRARVHGTTG